MVNDDVVEAFNTRPRYELTKKTTPAQLDKIKVYGSSAENLMTNRDFVQFIHHYKFELMDQLANITGHTPEDNERRLATAHYMSGIDGFIASLQRAKYWKDKVVSQQMQQQSNDPAN